MNYVKATRPTWMIICSNIAMGFSKGIFPFNYFNPFLDIVMSLQDLLNGFVLTLMHAINVLRETQRILNKRNKF